MYFCVFYGQQCLKQTTYINAMLDKHTYTYFTQTRRLYLHIVSVLPMRSKQNNAQATIYI